MTRLRRPLLALVALFTAAITIDRIAAGRGGETIASTTYAIAVLAVAAPLTLASLRHGRPRLATGIALAVYAIALLLGDPAGRDVHVLATEVAFLVVAVRLGHHIARTIAELDEMLGAIAFGESRSRDIESPEAAEAIHDEIARSRRHDRPLSVTLLAPAPATVDSAADNAAMEVDRAMRRRYVFGRLARAVGDQLRRSDLLFEHRASGRLIVLSPETDADGATLLVKRVTEAAAIAGVPAATGSASFPGDAIGFEALLAAAEADLASRAEERPHLHALRGTGTR